MRKHKNVGVCTMTARSPRLMRLWQSKEGTTSVLFGLLIVPLVGMMALAVDYARFVKISDNMQASLDEAVLAAMKTKDLPAAQRQSIALAYFNANFKKENVVKIVSPKFTVNSDGTMNGTATAKIRMPFGQFVSVPTVTADRSAKVLAQQGTGVKVEIGMMVDLTGSMGQTRGTMTKLAGLKTAANDLLDKLYPQGDDANVRVAIAPMADYVNAGDYASQATGLSSTGSYALGTNLSSTKQGPFSGTYSGYYGNSQPSGSQFGAQNASSSTSTYSNTYCTAGNEYETYSGKYVGYSAYSNTPGAVYVTDKWYTKWWDSNDRKWKYDDHDWNGYIVRYRTSNCSEAAYQSGKLITCVTERTSTSTRYTDDAPSSGNNVGAYNQSATGTTNKLNYSADGKCYVAGRELPSIIPLTSSKSTLQSFFTNATAGGATPGHLGHAWAWYMLSPKWSSIWPSASKPADYTDTGTRKIAIIMTDGEYNTQYSNVATRTQALALCASMKAANVEVYTIGFGFSTGSVAGDGTSEGNAKDLLTQCSSGQNHYYFPYDASALSDVFNNIGDSIKGQASTVSQLKLQQ